MIIVHADARFGSQAATNPMRRRLSVIAKGVLAEVQEASRRSRSTAAVDSTGPSTSGPRRSVDGADSLRRSSTQDVARPVTRLTAHLRTPPRSGGLVELAAGPRFERDPQITVPRGGRQRPDLRIPVGAGRCTRSRLAGDDQDLNARPLAVGRLLGSGRARAHLRPARQPRRDRELSRLTAAPTPGRKAAVPFADPPDFTSSRSTTKISVAFGPIAGGEPWAP